VYSVGLASIIAKVTWDIRAMQWNNSYPEYGFDIHKGYATKDPIEALHKHDPCPLHRMLFKSLKGR
jgi:ribonuclease HII